QLTTIVPGRTPCLACLYPEAPPAWRRRFPVFGAVAGVIGSLAATEAIKVLAVLGEPLLGRLLLCDLRDMTFRRADIKRRPARAPPPQHLYCRSAPAPPQPSSRAPTPGTCPPRFPFSATRPRNSRDRPRRPCVSSATTSMTAGAASCRTAVAGCSATSTRV